MYDEVQAPRGFGLLFLILGILSFAGVGALTATSRYTYAFARDGPIPGSRLSVRIDKRWNMPLWGLVLSTLVDMVCKHLVFLCPEETTTTLK